MGKQMPNTRAYLDLAQAVKELALLLGKLESSTLPPEDLTPHEKMITTKSI